MSMPVVDVIWFLDSINSFIAFAFVMTAHLLLSKFKQFDIHGYIVGRALCSKCFVKKFPPERLGASDMQRGLDVSEFQTKIMFACTYCRPSRF
jgi:hypothetical protein